MKKSAFVWGVLSFCFTGIYAQSAHFTVKGTMPETPTEKIYLYQQQPNDQNFVAVDSVAVKDGKFQFKRPIHSLEIYGVSFKNADYPAELLVSPGEIININFSNARNVYSNYTIEGSAMKLKYDSALEHINLKLKPEYDKVIETATAVAMHKQGVNEMEADETWLKKNMAMQKEMDISREEMRRAKVKIMTEMIQSDLANPLSPLLLLHSSVKIMPIANRAFSADEKERLIKKMKQAENPATSIFVLNDFDLAKLKKHEEGQRNLQIGGDYSNFEAINSKGGKNKLSEYMDGKSYVLIDFWASWCGPCRADNPNLLKVYNAYKDDGFRIVAFSIDTEKDSWLKAIKEDGMPWIHLSDLKGKKSPIGTAYGIMEVPSNFLFDPNGKVIAHNLKGKELMVKMKELLNK